MEAKSNKQAMTPKLAAALEALESDPDDAGGHLAAAKVYLEEKVPVAAAGHLKQAARAGLDVSGEWVEIGRAHLEEGHLKAAAAALDRAILRLPGEPEVRKLHASAWRAFLEEGGQPPPPGAPSIPNGRAEVAIFALGCASWDLLGGCLSHFIAHWLADAAGVTRPVCTITTGGRSPHRRPHPSMPDEKMRAATASRTRAEIGVFGDLVLAAKDDYQLRARVAPLGKQGGGAALDHTLRPPRGKLASGVAEALGLALDRLVPRKAARRARQDLVPLAALSDDAFLELVVLAEAGFRGKTALARRVAKSASSTALGRGICRSAARSISATDPQGAISIAEILLSKTEESIPDMLLLGEMYAATRRKEATALLKRVVKEATGGYAVEALAALGELELAAGRTDAAKGHIHTALKRDSSHGGANVLAAEISRRAEDLDGMHGHLIRGMARLTARERHAEIDKASEPLLEAGRSSDLLELASAASQDGTNTPTIAAAYAAGALQSGLGCLVRASVLLESHLEKEPENEEQETIRALFLETTAKAAAASFKAGHNLDALKRFRRALEVDPSHEPARLACGELLLSLDRPEEAREILQEATHRAGGLKAWALLAKALIATGREEEARDAAKRAGDAASLFPELFPFLDQDS